MTYKGDKIIGKPTLAMVEIFVSEKGLFCEPQECYDYWEKKNWLTHKNFQVKSLEAAILSYNSLAVQRVVKEQQKRHIASKSRCVKQTHTCMPYVKQLKDKRWYAFRRFVFAVRGRQCEICGSIAKLQVHHPKYKKNLMAWEYSCKEVKVVCSKCHNKIHGTRQ